MQNQTPEKKHFIITGASRGLGRHIALLLAAPDTVLHLVNRSESSGLFHELQEKGAEVYGHVCDLGSEEDFRPLIRDIAALADPAKTGFIALINNAGTIVPAGPAGKYRASEYLTNLKINYTAPVMLTHSFLEEYQDAPMTKRVVMISSGAALKPLYGWSHYCSSKAGINMFTKVVGLEQEQKKHPVGIVSFNPGPIDTDMQEQIRKTSPDDLPIARDLKKTWEEGEMGDVREMAGRLVRQLLADYFPSGKVLSHLDI